jgi:Uma2 family endonuclease
MAIEILRHSFTVADYEQMLATGILREDDHVELIDGEVRQMSPIGPYHAALVARLNRLLVRQAPDTTIVRVQDPVQLSEYSQPQPDLALVAGRDDFYAQGHPTAQDIYLLIEVSDSSLAYDRGEKLPRYAQAGVEEVWIVDSSALQIEQYWQPAGGQYRTKQTWGRGEIVRAHALPELALDVDAIFG